MVIKELGEKYKQYIIDLRREFHAYPEPSLYEFKTSEKIKRELDNMGISYVPIAGTGVLATIKGKKEGKTVALRADIDGLSVEECNNVEYKSQNKGYMHACGHDCHIAMLLGAAKILNAIKDKLNGTVKLMFQPAEEVAEGAKRMIKEGALEGVDGVFGIHVWSDIEYGKVCVEEGPRMASADLFTIKVKGKGGHGSAPHQGIDAVVASSAIVMNLQSIVSREISPLENAVVSVGSLKAGSRFNVIASEGILEGTTRCFNPEIRENFPKILERVAKNTAEAYRATAELEYNFATPVVINDVKCSKIASGAAKKVGIETTHLEKISGGEDFGEFMNRVPGVIALLGVRNAEKGACYPQHHPNYSVDEDALPLGSSLYAQYAVDFLNEQ
ncbi:M20 family metallopeptidase [Clostridium thermopalmarium]|uniref:Putative hydrolase YxeP n=1 Tax=Clostridium thermopalmarium DSM 5974 TaxID=1121340 RepID=A0A2T0ALF0_9CLOT|nr:M20 family metallopeptidase [Clostridium thermopalmarium]PRR69452.1 putative hydrolase YxeP [Clostridium thermopalmarium DSM 5974]PVZ26282.1 amidohydrolase [Clostridium thermopalmarium DSM 5974]